MFRKMVPAVLAAGALLTLAACGTSSSGSTEAKDGVKMGPGVTDKQIKVGILTDYSGPIAEAATAGSLGLEVKLKEVNADGGICGRKLVAVKGDTKYDAQQTTQAYRSTAGDVLMLGQLLGTASINAVKENIARDDMPTMAVSLNTTTLKNEDVYVPLPTFEVELMNGLVWAAEQAKASESSPVKVGVVTSADDYGKVYLDAVESAAEGIPGVEVVSTPRFAPTDKDYTAQVSDLKSSGSDIVLLGTGPGETAGFIGTSAQLGFKPTWVAESGAWTAALAQPLKGLLNDFYVSGGYGTLQDDVPGIQALNAAIAEHAPDAKPNNFQVGGWLMGETTVAALAKACENKDLTREGVIEALKNLKVDYQGITPAVDLGNGSQIVSYNSRMNKVEADGQLSPISEFFASDAAKAWGEKNGF